MRTWYKVLVDEYGDGATSLVCYAQYTEKEIADIAKGEFYTTEKVDGPDTWYAPTSCLRCGRPQSYKLHLDYKTGYLCERCREEIENEATT